MDEAAQRWQVFAHRADVVDVSEACPRQAYLEARIPDVAGTVDALTITTLSRDQGWTDTHTSQGSYLYSCSWFEVTILTPSYHTRWGSHRFQFNRHGHPELCRHVNRWTSDDPDPSKRDWLAQIRRGDVIQVTPRADYKLWQNIVSDVTITVTGQYAPDPSPGNSPANDLNADLSGFYRPLDSTKVQTRILTLFPGDPADALHCAIETVQLDDTSRDDYEALSYCWGDTTDQDIIQLKSTWPTDGSQDEFRPFPVHRSLHDALLHLRPSSGPPRKLWADAICINQADFTERAQQVTAMPLVYQHAKRVVIWLGPVTPKRRDCVAKIQEIQRSIHQLRQQSHVYTEVDWLELVREAAGSIANDREDAKHFLQQWAECDFDWFARTWVLQEVANSRDRTVFCGNEEISWDTFCSLERRIQKAQQEGNWATFLTPSIMPSTFLNLVSDTQTPEQGIAAPPARKGILETILAAHVMKATDARDKLFAMLQFGEDTSAHVSMDLDLQDPRIRPDYYKPPTTVFCDFVRWWIDKHKSLRILSAVHTLRNRSWQRTYYGEPIDISTLTYPTWSINLADGGDSNWAKATLGLDLGSSYQASGLTKPNIAVNDAQDAHTLQIAGRRICTVQKITPFPYWQPGELGGAWIELRNVFSQIFDPTALRRSKRFIAIKDDMPELQQEDLATQLADALQDSDRKHYTCHYRVNPDSQVSLPCVSPCLFVAAGSLDETSTKHGLCPHNARSGDVVVMLFGGAVLYLLRPKDATDTEASDAKYYFIGECYLHGYMRGQALKANEAFAAGREPEIFNLV